MENKVLNEFSELVEFLRLVLCFPPLQGENDFAISWPTYSNHIFHIGIVATPLGKHAI